MSEQLNHEVKYCIYFYLVKEGQTDSALSFAIENKLFFPLQHLKDLITFDRLEEADAFLCKFLRSVHCV